MRDLDLEIEPGERVLLLGASGSGKSTLLAALAGVLGGDDEGETHGVLAVDGVSPADQRGRSGLLMQDPDAQVVLARVGDDVAFGCENLGVPRDEIWMRVRHALEAVGLDLPMSHSTSELSGGQKQRLALAGVLAMQPGLILLDEPTANLDPAGVGEVRDAVGRVLETTGATLVVVEHRVSIWLDLVDRVVVLGDHGGVLADGHPDAVFGGDPQQLRDAGVWLPRASAESAVPQSLTSEQEPRSAPAGGRLLLETTELSIGRKGASILASGLELCIAEGSATAVTGPNGVGKSTLALTLGGLLAPRAGRVIASHELADGAKTTPIQWRSAQLLTRIASVFQSPEHQFLAQTVRRELAVGPHALGRPQAEIDAVVDELMTRLRLDRLADANPFTLSGGQKRRLSVATALATRPKLLIFDEPTFGQDATTWRELIAIFRELRRHGHALVSVTHDTEFIEAIGGASFAMGPASEPRRLPAIEVNR